MSKSYAFGIGKGFYGHTKNIKEKIEDFNHFKDCFCNKQFLRMYRQEFHSRRMKFKTPLECS